MASRVVCLLPVRNAAPDLPGFFDSVERFADVVIALDDGSTDETAELLQGHQLVKKTITNPIRSGYGGWDDARNRNRLLEQASAFDPDWIISVDADERIPKDDAVALREFLDTDALPGIAYGFRCYSMVGDLEHAQINPIWVYRLFAYQPGQRFPNQALHFAPIPTSIQRRAFIRTTFRIQHLGGVSVERKVARYEKYRQADPECRYWPDYSSLLKEPAADELMPWRPRPNGAGFIFTGEPDAPQNSETGRLHDTDSPLLSIVVIDDGPAEYVNRAIRSALAEGSGEHREIVVVTSRPDAINLQDQVKTVASPDKSPPSLKRNLGLLRATGTNVLFLDASTQLVRESVGAVCEAHREGYAVVTGSVISREDSPSLKRHVVQRFGFDATESTSGVLDRMPPWASYRRSLLIELGGFDGSFGVGDGHLLALKLESLGYVAYSIGDPIVDFRPGRSLSSWEAIRNSADIGKAISRFQLLQYEDEGQLIGRAFRKKDFVSLSVRRQGESTSNPDDRGIAESSCKVAIEFAALAGAASQLLRPERNKAITLAGRPAGVALLVLHRASVPPLLCIVRFDLDQPALRVVFLPQGLLVPAVAGSGIDLHRAFAQFRNKKIDRFTLHDLIGRPFQIEIDDLIVIDEEKLPDQLRSTLQQGTANELPENLPPALAPLTILAILRSTTAGRGIVTTLSRSAILLGLSRMRVTPSDGIKLLHLPIAGEVLDSDSAEMVRSFLDAGSIVRPSTQRNRLRLVEWA